MIEALKKIWRFSGREKSNINKSVLFCFLNAIFHMFEIAAIYVVVLALVSGVSGGKTAWTAFGLILVSILGNAVTKYFSQLEQTHAGYFMAANKRIDIAARLKSVPMGYFNDNSLGEITGVSTTVLDNVENIAPMVLVGILSGLINAAVFIVMILAWDWDGSLSADYLTYGEKVHCHRTEPPKIRSSAGGRGAGICAGHERDQIF